MKKYFKEIEDLITNLENEIKDLVRENSSQKERLETYATTIIELSKTIEVQEQNIRNLERELEEQDRTLYQYKAVLEK